VNLYTNFEVPGSSALRRTDIGRWPRLYKQEDWFVRLTAWASHSIRLHYSHHISNCEIKKIVLDALQLLTSSGADDCNSSATLQGLNLKWTTIMLYVPQFEDRLLTGNNLEGDQDRHGLELFKTIWKLPTLVCTPRGSDRKIVLTGGTSLWQQRSTRGMLLTEMFRWVH